MIFNNRTIGLAEMPAVKRKSHRLIEGFKTWCCQFRLTQKQRLTGQARFCEVSLLCAYRTQIFEELKEKVKKFILT